MTSPWSVPRLWPGETVAVLASGPSMSRDVAESARHLPCIAVRRTCFLAPWAALLVALDGTSDAEFWNESRSFAGLRVCGAECSLDVLCLPLPHEVVTLAPGRVVHIRNNGLAAIRIAALGGAAKILLLGFDTERYEEIHAHKGFMGLTAGLAQITAELRGRGIEIERIHGAFEG